LNRRSPAPEAGGLPSFPTSRVVSFSDKCPAGVEPARPPWQGGRLPLHHGHDPHRSNCQRAESTEWDSNPRRRITGAVSSPLDDRCLHRNGTGGARTLTTRLRAGCSAARTSIPINIASRPRRSRTFVARLSAECSPVELQAVAARHSLRSAPGELNPSSLAYKASALPLS
jgi:hypothetical protein